MAGKDQQAKFMMSVMGVMKCAGDTGVKNLAIMP